MKLYATTTSERATKGQGGNEYLNIALSLPPINKIYAEMELRFDDILKEYTLKMLPETNGEWIIVGVWNSMGDYQRGFMNRKSKKQKGD